MLHKAEIVVKETGVSKANQGEARFILKPATTPRLRR